MNDWVDFMDWDIALRYARRWSKTNLLRYSVTKTGGDCWPWRVRPIWEG